MFGRQEKPQFGSKASVAVSVPSPDKAKILFLRSLRSEKDADFPTEVELRTGDKKIRTRIRFGLNAEILWSPDSNAFAISGSSEGANGLYWTDVFLIRSDRLVVVPVTKMIWRAFGHPVKCGWPEYPNVGSVAWLQPSARILVAAEIIHHSNCDSFGTFKAYEIDIPTGKIVTKYNQLEAKKLFKKELGDELVQGPDKCILTPKDCYVPANHPELQPH